MADKNIVTLDALDANELKKLRNKFNAWKRRNEQKRDKLISENPNITDDELYRQGVFIRDEEVKQCNDKDLIELDPKLYTPFIAVSNMGRVWSIPTGKWFTPMATGAERNYYQINPNYNHMRCSIKVHRLVAFYFMSDSDRECIARYGVENTEVHHIRSTDVSEDLKKAGFWEDKQMECMVYNNFNNLQVIYNKDHKNVTATMNGKNSNFEFVDPLSKIIANTMGAVKSSDKKMSIEYSENDGKQTDTVNMETKFPNKYVDKDDPLDIDKAWMEYYLLRQYPENYNTVSYGLNGTKYTPSENKKAAD